MVKIVQVRPRWRRVGEPGWVDLPTSSASPFDIELPSTGRQIEVEVRLADENGIVYPGKRKIVNPAQQVDDDETPAPKDLTWPTPEVRIDQGVVEVTPTTPKGYADEDYVFDVRIGPDTAGDETETLAVGTVQGGETAIATALPEASTDIYVRPFRRDDMKGGAWQTVNAVTPSAAPEFVDVEDNDGTDFTGGTFETLYGYTPLEEPGGGGIRNAAVPPIWNTTNTTSIWGMSTDGLPIWAMATYWPKGVYTTEEISDNAVHEFLPVAYPEFSSNTYDSQPIWGMETPVFTPLVDDPAPTDEMRFRAREDRLRDMCIWDTAAGMDRGPTEVEQEISLTQNGSSYGSFAPLVPGRRYRARGYKMRLTMRSRLGRKQVLFSKYHLRRWIRNRKYEYCVDFSYPTTSGRIEYTFDPVPELTTDTPVAVVSVMDSQSPVVLTDQYTAKVEELTRTTIDVAVQKVATGGPTWTTPAVNNLKLLIVLTGY